MGKTKSAKPSKEASTPRKAAGVTKASQAPKAVSKDMAKSAAKAIEKSKKKVKEVKPASSSEEDSDDSDSDSSESEEEKVPAKKASKAKATNGKVVKGKKAVASSSESSDSSDSDSDEEMTAPKAATNGKAKDSDSDSSDSSDSDSEEAAKPAKAKTNGKKVVAAPVADEDSSDSSDSSDEETEAKADSKSSDEDSDDSDSDDSDAEVETKAVEEAPKKRKFEDAEEDTSAKKAKTDGPAEGSTLWAGQLSWNVDDEWLKQEFTACEGLVSARVVTDRETGRSRGFGFIDFSSPEGAKAALEAMNGKEIDGRGIKLDIAPARNNDGPKPRDRAQDRANKHGDVVSPESSTLFVGNIPFGITQNEVWEFFGDGVEVKNVRLPTNPESGELKGFGYVEFNSVEDAKSAFESKNGAMLGPGRAARALRLDYAQARDDSAPRGGGRGGGGGFGGRGGGRGRGGFGDRGGRGGGRGGGGFRGGRGGFGDRGGRGGSRIDPHAGGSGSKITFDD